MIWRHLLRNWRVNGAVLLCLTLASALAASLSGYADAIAGRELSRTWEAASPSDRTLLVTGSRDALSDALYADVQIKLGGLVRNQVVIRRASLVPDSVSEPPVVPWAQFIPGSSLPPTEAPPPAAQSTRPAMSHLMVYSFEPLAENVRVVEGKLPEALDLRKEPEPWRPPPIETVIGVRAAQLGYRVGDRLTATSKYHRLDIVGIVEPTDPQADIWGGDLSAFESITDTLPMIIDSHSMQVFYPMRPVFPHDVSWRITLNSQRLSVDRADALRSNLINLETQSATQGAVTRTGLVQILTDYLARLSRLRMALLLLTGQTVILVLYTLAMFASFVVDRSRNEFAALSGRGASPNQITLLFAVENLVLAAAAVILSPAFALGAIRVWAGSTGEMMPIAMTGEAWVLSGVVAALGWLSLVVPVFLAARRSTMEWRAAYARPPKPSPIHKGYADLYLLAFGVLLYWQLNQVDSFVMSRLGNTVADPLLLIGPFLLLVGAAMVLLRLLPVLLQLVARLSSSLKGLTLSQGLLRLSRDSQQPTQVILLVSLTTGLVQFTLTLGNALAGSPEPMARYLAGALQLNALALVLFSAIVFFLAQLFAAQGRAREFSILSAMGIAQRHGLALLVTEGALVLFLGLATGGVVGLGMAQIMLPYLAQALTGWQLGIAVGQATISGRVVAQSYVLLIAVYGLALALLCLVLVRTRGQWAVWREEE